MPAELLNFWANFFAIIVFALAVDSQKKRIATFLVDGEEGFEVIDLEITLKGIHAMNTMSLTFASAINSYECFSTQSSRHLTLVSLAYLLNLSIFQFMLLWKRAR